MTSKPYYFTKAFILLIVLSIIFLPLADILEIPFDFIALSIILLPCYIFYKYYDNKINSSASFHEMFKQVFKREFTVNRLAQTILIVGVLFELLFFGINETLHLLWTLWIVTLTATYFIKGAYSYQIYINS